MCWHEPHVAFTRANVVFEISNNCWKDGSLRIPSVDLFHDKIGRESYFRIRLSLLMPHSWPTCGSYISVRPLFELEGIAFKHVNADVCSGEKVTTQQRKLLFDGFPLTDSSSFSISQTRLLVEFLLIPSEQIWYLCCFP